MVKEEYLLKELFNSSLCQVEDYTATIRETVEANLSPNNNRAVYEFNCTLISIDDLATQLEHLVLLCKDKLKHIVPEPNKHLGDDDVDPDDVVPFDWIPPPKYDYLDGVLDVYYDCDDDLMDELW